MDHSIINQTTSKFSSHMTNNWDLDHIPSMEDYQYPLLTTSSLCPNFPPPYPSFTQILPNNFSKSNTLFRDGISNHNYSFNHNNNDDVDVLLLDQQEGRREPDEEEEEKENGGVEEDEEEEELGAMKEMMYKIAAMQPVDIDPTTIRRPKRRNVRISNDPQSVAARHRRERISEKMRILQRLVPGGTKMDTASMLDEAIRYVKFLKKQIRLLQSDQLKVLEPRSNNNPIHNGYNWEEIISTSNINNIITMKPLAVTTEATSLRDHTVFGVPGSGYGFGGFGEDVLPNVCFVNHKVISD